MGDCNGTALYCYPTENQVLRENATYLLEWNPDYPTIKNVEDVDLYLYRNASPPPMAQKIPSYPNDGQLTFTIDDVWHPSNLLLRSSLAIVSGVRVLTLWFSIGSQIQLLRRL